MLRPVAWAGERARFRDLFGTETKRWVRERAVAGATGVVVGVRTADTSGWTRWFVWQSVLVHPRWAMAQVEIDHHEVTKLAGAPRPVFAVLEPGEHEVMVRARDGDELAATRVVIGPGEVATVSVHPARTAPVPRRGRVVSDRSRPSSRRAGVRNESDPDRAR